MPYIHLAHIEPSHWPAALHPGTTIQGDKIQEPATLIYDACSRPGSLSIATNHTETKPLSHRSGSWKGPDIAAEYSAGHSNRTPEARVTLHIPKPKFQESIKNKMYRNHKLINIQPTGINWLFDPAYQWSCLSSLFIVKLRLKCNRLWEFKIWLLC